MDSSGRRWYDKMHTVENVLAATETISRGDSLKPLNFILCLILVLMLAFAAFFFAGGTLATSASSITAAAADYPEAFESIRGVISSDTAPQLLSNEALGDASGYTLVDVNITLSNRGVFDAEWLNIQVEGAPGDVAVYSLTGDGLDVPARSSAQVNLKLLTRAPANTARQITIQYYVYGISRSVHVTA